MERTQHGVPTWDSFTHGISGLQGVLTCPKDPKVHGPLSVPPLVYSGGH